MYFLRHLHHMILPISIVHGAWVVSPHPIIESRLKTWMRPQPRHETVVDFHTRHWKLVMHRHLVAAMTRQQPETHSANKMNSQNEEHHNNKHDNHPWTTSSTSVQSMKGHRLQQQVQEDHVLQSQVSPSSLQHKHEQPQQEESAAAAAASFWVVGCLVSMLTGLSIFILVNEFIGPWPMVLFTALPSRVWLLLHYLGGLLFAGGIVVTTALEWLVVGAAAAAAATSSSLVASPTTTFIETTKDKPEGATASPESSNVIMMTPVLWFWFERVPALDAGLVIPGLALTLISGVAYATDVHGGLGTAPPHIHLAFYVLNAFALWWALTDVTTQGQAAKAIQEWSIAQSTMITGDTMLGTNPVQEQQQHKQQQPIGDEAGVVENNDIHEEMNKNLPAILYFRRLSNIGSCLFVIAMYAIMTLKPGTT